MMSPPASESTSSRPMPGLQRREIVEQYRGRRRLLAEAAHAWLTYHENPEKYSINWDKDTKTHAARIAQGPYYGLFPTEPQCLCEEDFLGEVLWRFISNTPAEEGAK